MIFNPGLVPQASGGAVYGTYTGNSTDGKDGTYSQKIETGFRVGAVILTTTIAYSTASTSGSSLILLTGSMNSKYFESDDTGFIVKEVCEYYSKKYSYYGFNRVGTTYYYLAFPEA